MMTTLERQQRLQGRAMTVFGLLVTGYVLTMIVMFPLYMPGLNFHMLMFNRANLLVSVTGFFGTIFLILLFLFSDLFIQDKKWLPAYRFRVYDWAVLVFAIFLFSSTLLSPYQGSVWHPATGYRLDQVDTFWVQFSYVLAFFMVSRLFVYQSWLMVVWAVTGIGALVLALLQHLHVDVLGLVHWYGLDALFPLFTVPFGNRTIASSYGGFITALFLGLFLTAGHKLAWLYLMAATGGVLLLWMAASDGGWLGLFGMLFLAIPYVVSRRVYTGRLLVALSAFLGVTLWHNHYLYTQQQLLHSGELSTLTGSDQTFLNGFTPLPTTPLVVGAIGLGIAGVLLLFLLKRWPESLFKKLGIIALPTLVVIGVVGILIIGPQFEGRAPGIVYEVYQLVTFDFAPHLGSYRMTYWRAGLASAMKEPWFGLGPGLFWQNLPQHYVDFMYERGEGMVVAHNRPIQIAATLGFPAAIAYVVFLISTHVAMAKKAFTDPVVMALGMGTVAYTISSLVTVESPTVTPLFWILIGAVVAQLTRPVTPSTPTMAHVVQTNPELETLHTETTD